MVIDLLTNNVMYCINKKNNNDKNKRFYNLFLNQNKMLEVLRQLLISLLINISKETLEDEIQQQVRNVQAERRDKR